MEVIKILGQVCPTSTSETIYTVPSDKGCVISYINICNRDNYDGEISIQIGNSNALSESPEITWMENGMIVYSKCSAQRLKGVTLAQGDIVKVTSSTEFITFVLFGSEFDQTFEYP